MQGAVVRDAEGFTLIELLVVVIILGILAAIAYPNYLAQRQKTYEAAVRQDVRALLSAQFAALAEHGSYTDDFGILTSNGFNASMAGEIEHAVCVIGGGQSFIAAAKHELSDVYLLHSEQGAVVLGSTDDVTTSMQALDAACTPTVT